MVPESQNLTPGLKNDPFFREKINARVKWFFFFFEGLKKTRLRIVFKKATFAVTDKDHVNTYRVEGPAPLIGLDVEKCTMQS
jgi:hypothetical protein